MIHRMSQQRGAKTENNEPMGTSEREGETERRRHKQTDREREIKKKMGRGSHSSLGHFPVQVDIMSNKFAQASLSDS